MIEKVNPCHPDKVADRIAGAIVDLAYSKVENPKIAVEVLLGHGVANIIIESSVDISQTETEAIVSRITKREDLKVSLVMVAQDPILAHNQDDEIRCGDNGIFKGVPLTDEERLLSKIAHDIYERYPSDGKYILGNGKLIICQSNAKTEDLKTLYPPPSSTLWETGAVALTWTLVRPTANWVRTWHNQSQAVAYKARTYQRPMSR